MPELSQVGFATYTGAFPVLAPRTYISEGFQGTLGFGFPTALGAKVANRGKAVVSVTGDGGFMFGVQELATAAQYGIALVTIVFNNHSFANVLRDQQTHFAGRTIGSHLHNPDFVRLAESFGVAARRVKQPHELAGRARSRACGGAARAHRGRARSRRRAVGLAADPHAQASQRNVGSHAMMALLASIEQNALSVWVRESPSLLAFPFILYLHTLGLAMLAGINVGLAVWLLARRTVPSFDLTGIYRVMWLGFGINAVSGLALLAAYPAKALTNWVFFVKLVLVAAALWALQRTKDEIAVANGTAAREVSPARPPARAAVSDLLGRHDLRRPAARLHAPHPARERGLLMDAFIDWIVSTRLSWFVTEYRWVWPIAESVHFCGLTLLAGTVGLFDLRVLGFAKGHRSRARCMRRCGGALSASLRPSSPA